MKKLIQFALAATLVGSTPYFALAQNAAQTNLIKNVSEDATSQSAAAKNPQGYRDGMEAAKLDTLTKRKIDPKASHLYVHPPVKGNDAINQYRQSFEAGYNAAIANTSAS